MMIGVDIRSLLTPMRTGVGEYGYGLLSAVLERDRTNTYALFYNDIGTIGRFVPAWKYANVHFVRVYLPSKLLNASVSLVGRPRVGGKTYPLDYFFSPNPNFISLSAGVKHILTIHDLSFELFPECYSWKRRRWHRMVNPRRQCHTAYRILTPSEHTKRDVVRVYGVREEKVAVVSPGIPLERDSSEEKVAETDREVKRKYHLPEKFILFLGTIEPRKNIVGLIDAYVRYAARHTYPAGLVIAGPLGWKYRASLRAMKRTRGVSYVGPVSDREKSSLYRMARMCAYPTLYEGFGFPVLEAMRAGTPVLTSNRSSLPEVAGNAAYLVNPHDSAEIALGIERIFADHALVRVLREQGKRRVANVSWQRGAEQFLSLF